MNAQGSAPLLNSEKGRLFSRGKLADLDAGVVATIVAAGGDVAMVIDHEGVIRDIAVSNEGMARDGALTWLDQRWSDTVSSESRHKVDSLLHDALSAGVSTWREVNQITPSVDSMMVRYLAVDARREGQVIVIGRDDRATAIAQEHLLDAQQALERDYSRLRDAETRYRLLFEMSGEAVVVVDAATRRVVDANAAAERALAEPGGRLVGEVFARLFDAECYDEAASLISVVQSASRSNSVQMRLLVKGRDMAVSASLFRQDRTTQCLIRMTPAESGEPILRDAELPLQALLERLPDAFLVTDGSMRIVSANAAFLDLARIATKQQAVGQPLNAFLGRADVDRNILLDNLREHGSVRNFSTVLRNQYDDQEDVEVSAVSASEGPETCFAFTIRSVRRRQNDRAPNQPELRRSVEQLTELVGRVKLKELVRETTDLVERLCIEAALELTKDNRASAADVLGLSRQSLYSKLHRFGLGNLSDRDN
jgi:transcriptional regulator PpsR